MIVHYKIHQVSEYINWIYFFHAWGFAPKFATIADIHGCDACRALWLSRFAEEDKAKAAEALQLMKEAEQMLRELDERYETHALFLLMDANSQEDDLLLTRTDNQKVYLFPLLRQQAAKVAERKEEPYFCLSDFIRPASSGVKDKLGVFCTTVDAAMESAFASDAYQQLLVQTLADRLAEATADKIHLEVRRTYWGYCPEERLSITDLHNEKYQGIRPAVGYPSLPDQSVNFILDEILQMKQIGINITENGMMIPHASVSGLMFAHPQARYFSVGKIDQTQLKSYAQRRQLPLDEMKKYLAANL